MIKNYEDGPGSTIVAPSPEPEPDNNSQWN